MQYNFFTITKKTVNTLINMHKYIEFCLLMFYKLLTYFVRDDCIRDNFDLNIILEISMCNLSVSWVFCSQNQCVSFIRSIIK